MITRAKYGVPIAALLLCACSGEGVPEYATAEPRGAILSWPADAGASSYGVFVFEPPAKAPVWIWVGDSTKVRYGDPGLPGVTLPDSAPARPPLSEQAEFGVVAFNSAGGITGVQQRRKIQ